MDNEFVEAIDRTIANLVADFQDQRSRFWNERDVHWYLFHYLKRDPVFIRDYGIELIRAEFPTRAKYPDDRGHYDLVILDPATLTSPPVSTLPPWAPWDEFLPLVDVVVAVEVKTWVDRTTDIPQKANRDIEKLTDPQNAVKHAYFLNFIQLDFSRQQMRGFYQSLRAYFTEKAGHWSNLKILCVPHDKGIQPNPGQNWI